MSHVDSSSDKELSSCFGISDDDFNFEDRQNTFKEYHKDSVANLTVLMVISRVILQLYANILIVINN